MTSLKKIAYNCRKATLLIEKKQLIRLSAWETIELRIHLAGCSVCKLYQQQSITISNQIKKLFNQTGQEKKSLDEKFKKKLQEQIENKLRRP